MLTFKEITLWRNDLPELLLGVVPCRSLHILLNVVGHMTLWIIATQIVPGNISCNYCGSNGAIERKNKRMSHEKEAHVVNHPIETTSCIPEPPCEALETNPLYKEYVSPGGHESVLDLGGIGYAGQLDAFSTRVFHRYLQETGGSKLQNTFFKSCKRRLPPPIRLISPVPNISSLAVLIRQGKSPQKSHLGSPE